MDHDPRDHRHSATLADTVDFLNTDELDGTGRPIEWLPTLADVTRWLVEHGLLHADESGLIEASTQAGSAAPLGQAHAARAATREIVEALVSGRPADTAALAAVNRILQTRAMVELVPGQGGLTVGHRHVGDPLKAALAGIAEPLVALVERGEADRLRICANDGCRWVFHDTSRTGRRRWCSMASCGNRAKAARHRARKRAPAANGGAAGNSVRPAG